MWDCGNLEWLTFPDVQLVYVPPGTLGQLLSSRAVLIYTEISAKLALRLKQFAEISYSDNVFTKHCRLIVPGGTYTSCTYAVATEENI